MTNSYDKVELPPVYPHPPPSYFEPAHASQTMSKEEATTARAKVFEELGWGHLVEGDVKWSVLGNPASFAPF